MKQWKAGYLVPGGFKVVYTENSEENTMIFSTEEEAHEYFQEEKEA